MIGEKVVELLYPSCGPNGCLDPADLAVKQKNVTHGVNRSSLCLTVFAFVFRLRDGESRSALPRRGTKSHLILQSRRQVLLVVDEEGQFGAVRSGLSSIYMIRMGLRLVQMLGITRSRLTTSCNECPVPIFSSICFLRIRFRWIQMRGAPASTDDRPETPAVR